MVWRAAGMIVLALASGLLGACQEAEEGTAQVSALLSGADVARVELTVSGAGIDPALAVPLARTGGSWGGLVDRIPAGPDRTFDARAFDAAGTALYRGQATGVAIEPGRTTLVAIVAQQTLAEPAPRNDAPVIDALVVSSTTVAPGGAITLAVTAHDPDGDAMTYAWTAPAGTFSHPTAETTGWTAPAAEGAVPLTIAVSDSRKTSRMTVNLRVTASAGRGTADVTVTVNTWPVVSAMAAAPTRIDAGETTQLGATAADADGDAMTHLWSTACDGTFDAPFTPSPRFTLGTAPAAGACAFTVVVSDGRGGEGRGEVTIAAGPAPAVNEAPQLTLAYQSATRVGPGETVVVRVSAVDPEGTTLAFDWSATSGTLGVPATTGGTSHVTWTAPAAFGANATLRVAVADAPGATAVRTFDVAPAAAPGGP